MNSFENLGGRGGVGKHVWREWKDFAFISPVVGKHIKNAEILRYKIPWRCGCLQRTGGFIQYLRPACYSSGHSFPHDILSKITFQPSKSLSWCSWLRGKQKKASDFFFFKFLATGPGQLKKYKQRCKMITSVQSLSKHKITGLFMALSYCYPELASQISGN